MNALPNIITASRAVAALTMLFFPVFSSGFWVLYCWCGFSDMIDGEVARKINAVSKLGSMIDSVADLIFLICSVIMILPQIQLPVWIWLWIVSIGTVKVAVIVLLSCRQGRLTIPHSTANRITGFILFCYPFTLTQLDEIIPTILVCIVASLCCIVNPKNKR